jgi:hypothetical protein
VWKPPAAEPTITPNLNGSIPDSLIPESSTASLAATIEYCKNLSSLFASFGSK